ncbi:MAG: type II toxin-antitoxin system RelE/ParE family toxin [Aliidiomarina sp.]|uniref:type II toxin-antitoxin system RelE/ParE family toxin n=1 Tax=Aliidiomarina sp. TaxID=1872439 RepID=UPI0025C4FF69|nr:type II toxin-antitoxin system RelE/ParE family toxin [Aliidiomarina sp.]MCH8501227.1 type II toxin-antitoxin system RelE/ParE family toxin [Aliidiomarina sp.]
MYKLSKQAAVDFTSIFEYTLLSFGEEQAENYLNDLDETLNLLAHSPKIGSECSDLLEKARRHFFKKHVIYYQIKSTHIYIVRVLHQSMHPTL